MKRANGVLLLLSFGLASFSAEAAIYMCKDASGRTLTSDQPIPECADRAMKELGTNGVIRREIGPPMTAEERHKKEAEEKKKKEEAAAQEEKRKAAAALLARYRNEKDIEAGRQRALGTIQDEIKRDELSLVDSAKQLKQAQAQADSYDKKKMPVPADVQQKLDDAQHVVDEGNKLLEEHHQELDQINARFDDTLKRFREVNDEPAAK